MIRYAYNRQLQPPAPFVHVTLRTLTGDRQLVDLPAQLDFGADKTVVPWTVVEQLALLETRQVTAAAFGGHVSSLPAFLVSTAIRHSEPVIVEVLGSRDEAYVLLGRDVLNH